MTTTAERLKQALDIRNMKAVDLHRATKINKSSLSQYINGTVNPKQDRIYLMARALNVDELWLMGHDVPMERKPLPTAAPTTLAGSPAMDSSAPGGTQGSAEGADEGQGGTILMRAQNELGAEDLHQLELMAEHFLKRKLKGK